MTEKLSITLPNDMVGAIRQRVKSGAYASVSEVLREAMRVWMRQEEEHEDRMTAIRSRIVTSLNDPRPNLTVQEARERLTAHYAERTDAQVQSLSVEFRPTALEDIQAIFDYVLEKSRDAITAMRYTDRIFSQCERLGDMPYGGVAREDLGDGLRLFPFEKSAVIVYRIENDALWIVNVFAGGRDYEAILKALRS